MHKNYQNSVMRSCNTSEKGKSRQRDSELDKLRNALQWLVVSIQNTVTTLTFKN